MLFWDWYYYGFQSQRRNFSIGKTFIKKRFQIGKHLSQYNNSFSILSGPGAFLAFNIIQIS